MDPREWGSSDAPVWARVECRSCGVLHLEVAEIGVRVCLDDGSSTFHFRCPRCLVVETGTVTTSALEQMRALGVQVTPWSLPAELAERHLGDPISLDELVDACGVLADDARFHAALHDLLRPTQG